MYSPVLDLSDTVSEDVVFPDQIMILRGRLKAQACAHGAPLRGFGLDLFLFPEGRPSSRK